MGPADCSGLRCRLAQVYSTDTLWSMPLGNTGSTFPLLHQMCWRVPRAVCGFGTSRRVNPACGRCSHWFQSRSDLCGFGVWPLSVTSPAGALGKLLQVGRGPETYPSFVFSCSPTWLSVTRPETQLPFLCPSKCPLDLWWRCWSMCDWSVLRRFILQTVSPSVCCL